jgi:hypothetical protein
VKLNKRHLRKRFDIIFTARKVLNSIRKKNCRGKESSDERTIGEKEPPAERTLGRKNHRENIPNDYLGLPDYLASFQAGFLVQLEPLYFRLNRRKQKNRKLKLSKNPRRDLPQQTSYFSSMKKVLSLTNSEKAQTRIPY